MKYFGLGLSLIKWIWNRTLFCLVNNEHLFGIEIHYNDLPGKLGGCCGESVLPPSP